jgi:hypothetical protein
MPRVLFASGLLWPNIVRLSRAFHDVGFDVAAIAMARHPVHRSQVPNRTFLYRPADPRTSLRAAIADFQPDIVIPCDDRAVGHLRTLYAIGDHHLAELIQKSLGHGGASGALASRAALSDLGSLPNVKVARTSGVASVAELRDWVYRHGLPAVLKLDGTWGGQDVIVVHQPSEIRRAFLSMRLRRGVFRRLIRFVLKRDVEALRFSGSAAVTVASYLEGRLANLAIACWKGEVVAQVAVEVLCTNGPFGNASVVCIVDGDGLVATARSICRQYQLSGIYGLDFILDANSAEPYLIEINSRATQTGHFPLGPGRDLAAALFSVLEGNCVPPCRPEWRYRQVALFPQEWTRDPKSPRLTSAFHDVPRDEPDLSMFYGFDQRTGAGLPKAVSPRTSDPFIA